MAGSQGYTLFVFPSISQYPMSFFSSDRLQKYYYGSIRLFILEMLIIWWVGESFAKNYVHSLRWLGHIYIGSIGAMVNVEIFSFKINLILLALAGMYIVFDVIKFDPGLVIYAMKTFGGDFIAGKLDTLEWKLVLFFSFVLGPALLILTSESYIGAIAFRYARIFTLLFLAQLFCECGDNYLESYRFFRYRYSYELSCIVILTWFNLQPFERDVVIFDSVICLFYRISNCLVILYQTDIISTYFKKFLFSIAGYKLRTRLLHVDNPALAVLVMKQSIHKGFFLEKYIALPAWYPIISLESVDGAMWKEMRDNFDLLLSVLPPASQLQAITRVRAQELVQQNRLIDANGLAQLTVSIFLEYVFHVTWDAKYQVLVDASWEWRKQIAVRGEGSMQVKLAVIDVLVNDLIPGNTLLWKLFGEKWTDPQYYSLIMQPFIISPCINTGDIMVALKRCGVEVSLEDAVRQYHPFPILERYVCSDIVMKGKVVVPAGTQVIMFTSDFNQIVDGSLYPWPIFGTGDRSCAGMYLALPYLRVLRQVFIEGEIVSDVSHGNNNPDTATTITTVLPSGMGSTCTSYRQQMDDLFQPELHHLYSGRHNDGKIDSIGELWYFLTTIARAMWIARANVEELMAPSNSSVSSGGCPVNVSHTKRSIAH